MIHELSDRSWVTAFYDSAAEWWGESWYEGENLNPRLERVERCVGKAPKKLLELGAGTGETAAFLAAHGYQVTAVDLADRNYQFLQKIAEKHAGFTAVQGDFYTVNLVGKFDAVCLFETFGMGSDQDQRRLLKRIGEEWLAPGGVVILDIYHPYGPIKLAGTSQELDRLEEVPGSVDMTERCFYDAVLGRWIDVWEPKNDPAKTRKQSIRCYTPADMLLLLEGTGLKIVSAEFCGEKFDALTTSVSNESPLLDFEKDYAYGLVLAVE